MDLAGTPQHRRASRSPVLLTARVEVGGCPVEVKLRNLSEKGALIEGATLPQEGSDSYFERNQLRLPCKVVWVEGRFAGVAFNRPLKPEEVLRQIPAPKQRIAPPDGRRPGLASRPLTPSERKMIENWITFPDALGD